MEIKSNDKWIESKLCWFGFNLFIKQIKILGFEFDSFIKWILGLIDLIHLVELINESNQI